MANIPAEIIILLIVIFLQLFVTVITVIESRKIKTIFAKQYEDYSLQIAEFKLVNDDQKITYRPLITSSITNSRLDKILSSINNYLGVHYVKGKAPDISQMESLIKNQSKINDSRVSLLASFPILIGLAGTIVGLLYAFHEINVQNIGAQSEIAVESSGNFLSLISKSSSIVFWGSLLGILLSIVLNYIASTIKLQRDIRSNHLILFINTQLSPALPTVKEETINLISQQLSLFSEAYFGQFKKYSDEFDGITEKIKNIYEIGFEEIIGKNTMIMEKLVNHIDSLEELNRTTKAVRIKPEMINEFVSASQELVESNTNSVNKLNDYSDKLNEYGQLFNQLNESFKYLQERVDKGVVNLSTDRNLIADFQTAMKKFAGETTMRTEEMSQFAQDFQKNIQVELIRYEQSLGKIGNSIEKNIQENLSPEDYVTILEKFSSISESLENESNNIKSFGETLNDLNLKISKELAPAIIKISTIVNSLSATTQELPGKLNDSMKDTIRANEKMILATSQQLLKEPRSWGQWSFLGAKRLFSRSKKKSK